MDAGRYPDYPDYPENAHPRPQYNVDNMDAGRYPDYPDYPENAHPRPQYNVDNMDAGRYPDYPENVHPPPEPTQVPPKETRSNGKRFLVLIGILVLLLMGVTPVAIYFGVRCRATCRTWPSVDLNEPPGSPVANTAVVIVPALRTDDRQIIYQGKDQKLKFATWASAINTWGSYTNNLGPGLSPKMNTSLAQLYNPSESRRIFFIDDKNVLSDAAFDTREQEWKLGSLAASKLYPAKKSKMTAITYGNGGMTTEWIYWQAPDGSIKETGFVSGEWNRGDERKFPDEMKAKLGSGIASAIRSVDGDQILTIFVHLADRIVGWGYQRGEWNTTEETVVQSDQLPDVVEGLSAVATESEITLYFSGKRFVSSVRWSNKTRAWDTTVRTYAEGAPGIFAAMFAGKQRVYYVKDDDEIGELLVDEKSWNASSFEEA